MTITYTCTFDEFRQASSAVRAAVVLPKKRTALMRITTAVVSILVGVWIFVALQLMIAGNPLGLHLLIAAFGYMLFSVASTLVAAHSVRQFLRGAGVMILASGLVSYAAVQAMRSLPHEPLGQLLEPHWGWFCMLVLLIAPSFLQRRRDGRAIWDAKKHLREPCVLETSPQGVVISNARCRAEYRWLSFTDLLETKDVIVLKNSPISFHLVPKRAFADPAQLGEFRALTAVIKTRKSEGFAVIPIPMAQRAPADAENAP